MPPSLPTTTSPPPPPTTTTTTPPAYFYFSPWARMGMTNILNAYDLPEEDPQQRHEGFGEVFGLQLAPLQLHSALHLQRIRRSLFEATRLRQADLVINPRHLHCVIWVIAIFGRNCINWVVGS